MYKISIITPSKNIDKNVINCINMVYAQKSKYELEHIIVVDAVDNVYIDKKPKREKYKLKIVANNGEDKGPSSARNIGISLSSGNYIFFLDSDDLWRKCHISSVMDIYIGDDSIDAVSCSGRIMVEDKLKNTITLPYIKDGFLTENQILWNSIGCPSGFSFKKNSAENRKFIEGINLCEDYLFYIGFIDSSSLIYRSNKNYFYYRLSSSQLSNLKDWKRFEILRNYLKNNTFKFKNYYQTILFNTQINRLAKRVCGLSTLKETVIMITISPSWVYASILKLFNNIFIGFINLKLTI